VGVWAGVAGAGTFASLLVSGALLEFFSWLSIFALSVVLAALALIGTAAVVPTSRDPEHAAIDSAGAVLSVAGISGVVFAIIEGPALGWASPTVVASFAFGVLALAGFVLWELHIKKPMLDPRLFLMRSFSAGTVAMTMSHVAIFGLFFVALQYQPRAAPPAREAARSPIVAGLVPVSLAAEEEDDLSASAARERQAPTYSYLRCAHDRLPLAHPLRTYKPKRTLGVLARWSGLR
jgi:MFS family permease